MASFVKQLVSSINGVLQHRKDGVSNGTVLQYPVDFVGYSGRHYVARSQLNGAGRVEWYRGKESVMKNGFSWKK